MGLAGAIVLINKVWMQYSTSPTITSVENTHFPIWNIPFPAVTVCQVNKVHYSAAQKLYKQEFSQFLEEKVYWAFVSQMAEIIQPEGIDFQLDFDRIQAVFKNRSYDMESLMKQLTQPCSSMLIKCKWRGKVTPCDQLFTMSKTDAGFCCSFNYFPPGSSDKHRVPRRVNGAGYLTGLSMLIDPRLEDYYAALFSFYGVQVLVHSYQDYPEISARGILLSPQKEAFLQVSAASTYSTPEVRALKKQQRQCLFEDEHSEANMTTENSHHQDDYTYSNCLIQCRMNYMDKLCHCAPYFFPTGPKTKLCGLEDVACLASHTRVFNNLRSPHSQPGLDDNENAMTCDCHPTCADVTYSTEISESTFFKSEYDQTNFFKEVPITNHSILHVYFKDLYVIRFRRDVIYSWNDLLASFGGIVGLCLGSSLISLVEMIYFFTVRPACNMMRPVTVKPVTLVKQRNNTILPPPYNWLP
ncbi:hypothetical protein L9F63_019540 [Diploptera punctata]|uniref:Uncharacterized protein n=1 Tax=Diploptera punctata TaxID=6984 RepID=A0AAD8EE06_DIPPU|nr:hypothetical protein L9F63_019540 [Diploptera punctata]